MKKNNLNNNSSAKSAIKIIIAIIVLILLFTLPMFGSEYIVMLLMLMCMYIGLGQMWNLLSGYAGLISLGQQLYIGIGGYALAVISNNFGLPLFVRAIVGGIISSLLRFAVFHYCDKVCICYCHLDSSRSLYPDFRSMELCRRW